MGHHEIIKEKLQELLSYFCGRKHGAGQDSGVDQSRQVNLDYR